MKEFKVNKYITLKLEGNKINIYVIGKKFSQCKFLLLEIPIDEITSLDEIQSIDEAVDHLDSSLELRTNSQGDLQMFDNVLPEVEFWGHCSNLQVWVENNYNTCLLHSNLAFPLLKRLTEVGDPIAKKVFGEEIAKRIMSKHPPTIAFLAQEGYIDYLPRDYIELILKKKILKPILEPQIEKIREINIFEDIKKIDCLIGNNLIKYIDFKEIYPLLKNSKLALLDRIIDCIYNNTNEEERKLAYSFLERLGQNISDLAKRKLEEFINNNDLESLLKYVEASILNNLKKKDFLFLLNDINMNLLEKILEGLRSTKKDHIIFIGYQLFSERVKKFARRHIKKKIIEIIEQNDIYKLTQIIGIGLLEYLHNEDIKMMINKPDIFLIENYLKVFDRNNVEIDQYNYAKRYNPYEFFKIILEIEPNMLKKKINKIIKTNDIKLCSVIHDYSLHKLLT